MSNVKAQEAMSLMQKSMEMILQLTSDETGGALSTLKNQIELVTNNRFTQIEGKIKEIEKKIIGENKIQGSPTSPEKKKFSFRLPANCNAIQIGVKKGDTEQLFDVPTNAGVNSVGSSFTSALSNNMLDVTFPDPQQEVFIKYNSPDSLDASIKSISSIITEIQEKIKHLFDNKDEILKNFEEYKLKYMSELESKIKKLQAIFEGIAKIIAELK